MQINITIEKHDKIILACTQMIAHFNNQKENLTVSNCGDGVSLEKHYDKKITEYKDLITDLNKQLSEQHSF